MSDENRRDEAEIRASIAAWSRALEAKDVDGLTVDYAPDVCGRWRGATRRGDVGNVT